VNQRPPLPPFSHQDALTKVRAAEDAWSGVLLNDPTDVPAEVVN